MGVFQMEIIVRTIEVGWHHSDVVSAILKIETFAHLQTRNLCNGVWFIGIFEWRGKQTILWHGLWCLTRIDAGRTEKQQFLHTMFPTLTNHILLNLQVLIDEVGTILKVCHDTTHMCSCQNNGIWLLLIEKLFHCNRVKQIKFLMTATHQIRITPLLEVVPNGRTHQTVMSCHIYLTILF